MRLRNECPAGVWPVRTPSAGRSERNNLDSTLSPECRELSCDSAQFRHLYQRHLGAFRSENVAEPSDIGDLEDLVDIWAAQIRIDEQDPPTIRLSERQRQVDDRERLSFVWQCARDHQRFEAALCPAL